MKRAFLLLISFVLVSGVAVSHAFETGAEFSADAVQTAPQRQPLKARMYAGKQGVRTEYNSAEQQYIEIVLPKQGKRLVLFPGQKTYMEQVAQVPAASKDKSPCAGVADAKCKMLGKETLNGRNTEKWELVKTVKGQPVRTLHWIDTERRLPIREFFPDGTVTELRQLGNEKLGGRNTEKWELSITSTDGQVTRSQQWYDLELKITIREEMPGGYLRELRNIKVASQPANLFQVPAGYRKVQAPPATAQGRPQR